MVKHLTERNAPPMAIADPAPDRLIA